MARAVWPLFHDRPIVSVSIVPLAGQPIQRNLLADTGAGTAKVGFDLLLEVNDCLACRRVSAKPVVLGGAYSGTFPVFVIRVQILSLGFDRLVRSVGVPQIPAGFGGIAGFRFLSRFTYGNFGVSNQFGLE
jgi:hypothetical protein